MPKMSSSKDSRAARRHQPASASAQASSSRAPSQNPLDRYTKPIIYKGSQLPFWAGTVRGECGNQPFIQQSEGIPDDIGRSYTRKPAFTQPRHDWSHWDENNPIRLSSDDGQAELSEKLKDD